VGTEVQEGRYVGTEVQEGLEVSSTLEVQATRFSEMLIPGHQTKGSESPGNDDMINYCRDVV
jgi:hypothetical protein